MSEHEIKGIGILRKKLGNKEAMDIEGDVYIKINGKEEKLENGASFILKDGEAENKLDLKNIIKFKDFLSLTIVGNHIKDTFNEYGLILLNKKGKNLLNSFCEYTNIFINDEIIKLMFNDRITISQSIMILRYIIINLIGEELDRMDKDKDYSTEKISLFIENKLTKETAKDLIDCPLFDEYFGNLFFECAKFYNEIIDTPRTILYFTDIINDLYSKETNLTNDDLRKFAISYKILQKSIEKYVGNKYNNKEDSYMSKDGYEGIMN